MLFPLFHESVFIFIVLKACCFFVTVEAEIVRFGIRTEYPALLTHRHQVLQVFACYVLWLYTQHSLWLFYFFTPKWERFGGFRYCTFC